MMMMMMTLNEYRLRALTRRRSENICAAEAKNTQRRFVDELACLVWAWFHIVFHSVFCFVYDLVV